MKVVIAGAHGLVGRALAEHLRDRHELVLLDWTRRGPTRGVIRADIRDWHDIRHALDRVGSVDAVINVCATPWVRAPEPYAALNLEIHVIGSWALFDECQRRGAHRLLLASSAVVYGKVENGEELHEETNLVERASVGFHPAYAHAKLTAENMVRWICETRGGTGAALRLDGVHVPGVAEPRGVHIDDVVDAFQRALEHDLDGFHVLNVSGAIEARKYSITRAHEVLGWTPQHPFELRPELEYWRSETNTRAVPRTSGARHVWRERVGRHLHRVNPALFRAARRVFRVGRG